MINTSTIGAPSGATKPRRVIAIASGGGHWVQLMRLRPALRDCEVTYVTVHPQYRADVGDARFEVVNDATRWNKFALVFMALRVLWIVLRVRPHAIVTTGAAPGYFALRFGKLLGARVAWIDSIANVEEVSMSGRRIGPTADLWLTQWAHLGQASGPHYRGSVL